MIETCNIKNQHTNKGDDEKINKKHFIGWPVDQALGGYNIQWKVTNNKTIEAYQISSEDSHPNALGHEKYAEFIYENLQYST